VLAGGNCHHQFRAHAVGGGNQDGVAIAGCLQVEQRAEAPKPGRCTASGGAGGKRLDRLDKRRAGVDIDACIAIAAGVYGVLRGDGL
jgi:hypothetical protein